jgi:hypothetical protein
MFKFQVHGMVSYQVIPSNFLPLRLLFYFVTLIQVSFQNNVCLPIDEELARMEDICMDAARKRLQLEQCVRIEKIREAIELKDFVILAAGNEVEEPFFVAEVGIN